MLINNTNIKLSNTLLIVNCLEKSIHPDTFDYFFNQENDLFELDSSLPYFYSKTQLNYMDTFIDSLIIYNYSLTEYTSQKILYRNIIPYLFSGNEYSPLFVLKTIQNVEILTFDIILNMYNYLCFNESTFITTPLITYSTKDNSKGFFNTLYSFENQQQSAYSYHSSNLLSTNTIPNEFNLIKLATKKDTCFISFLSSYYSLCNPLIDYTNDFTNDFILGKEIVSSGRKITYLPNCEIALNLKESSFSAWSENNSLKTGANWIKCMYAITNPKIRNVKNILIGLFNMFSLGLFTLVSFVICSVAFQELYVSYGFTSVYPLLFVISLIMSLIGDTYELEIIHMIINFLIVVYFWFIKALIIVSLNNIYKSLTSYEHFNEEAFISIFIINGVFVLIPLFLYIKKNITYSGLLGLVYYILVYPSYYTYFMSISFTNIISKTHPQIKLLFILCFLIGNFLVALLIYTIHGDGRYTLVLVLAIAGTIISCISIIMTCIDFIIFHIKTKQNIQKPNSMTYTDHQLLQEKQVLPKELENEVKQELKDNTVVEIENKHKNLFYDKNKLEQENNIEVFDENNNKIKVNINKLPQIEQAVDKGEVKYITDINHNTEEYKNREEEGKDLNEQPKSKSTIEIVI